METDGIIGNEETEIYRQQFPEDFLFGASASAYQFEGAAREYGKGPSIWDHFTTYKPEKIADGSCGFLAVDFYHKYKEDIATMKRMGINTYRLSISWPRLLPGGKIKCGVNQEGVKFYNDVINELLANDIIPFITLFHWDLPQALEEEYKGFMSPKIADDFRDYCEVCFWEFGDRVKNWITLNEPWSFSFGGYCIGSYPPGRGYPVSDLQKKFLPAHAQRISPNEVSQLEKLGDPGWEPYIVSHHQLLAHAAAVEAYRNKYQKSQGGQIGITLVAEWKVPLDESNEDDHIAARRALAFIFGWFMEPLTTGLYPQSMRDIVGNRLPKFTVEQSEMLIGSYDFLGVNYYTATYVKPSIPPKSDPPDYATDSHVENLYTRDGVLIGPKSGSSWLHSYPKGIYDLLLYIKRDYNVTKPIYITENGIDEKNNLLITLSQGCVDSQRIKYLKDHLSYLSKAINDGVNVKGYLVWSLLDNFEWASGYTVRFGMVYVDYKCGLERYPKHSAIWFMNFLKSKITPIPLLLSKKNILENTESRSNKRIRS